MRHSNMSITKLPSAKRNEETHKVASIFKQKIYCALHVLNSKVSSQTVNTALVKIPFYFPPPTFLSVYECPALCCSAVQGQIHLKPSRALQKRHPVRRQFTVRQALYGFRIVV